MVYLVWTWAIRKKSVVSSKASFLKLLSNKFFYLKTFNCSIEIFIDCFQCSTGQHILFCFLWCLLLNLTTKAYLLHFLLWLYFIYFQIFGFWFYRFLLLWYRFGRFRNGQMLFGTIVFHLSSSFTFWSFFSHYSTY